MPKLISVCKTLVLLAVILLLGCQNAKFNKTEWNRYDDPAFPPAAREAMLKDLITTHKLKGLTYKNLIELIGEAELKESNAMYPIIVNFGSDIDPIYTKKLVFKLDPDSVVQSFEVVEWRE